MKKEQHAFFSGTARTTTVVPEEATETDTAAAAVAQGTTTATTEKIALTTITQTPKRRLSLEEFYDQKRRNWLCEDWLCYYDAVGTERYYYQNIAVRLVAMYRVRLRGLILS